MRISELMILLNKYYAGEDKKLTIRHDKPRRYGEGRRVGIYMEDAGFRVDEYTEPGSSWYSFHTCEFRREGAAVYYLLNRPVYKEELLKHSFPEYEILSHVNDRGLKIPYGVVMFLDGVWHVYVGDSHLFYIKDYSIKTLEQAVDNFTKAAESDENMKNIINRFVWDCGQL